MMRWLACVLAGLTCAWTVVPPVHAETLAHEAAGLELWVPDGWSQYIDEKGLSLADPQGTASMRLELLSAESVEQALAKVDEIIAAGFEKFATEGTFHETELHGLPAAWLEGTAEVDGTPVELGIALVATPSGHVLLVLVDVDANAAETPRNEAVFPRVLEGIRPSAEGRKAMSAATGSEGSPPR